MPAPAPRSSWSWQGKARAILRGRTYVAGEDIEAVARPVLRHRLVLNFSAEADGVNVEGLLDRLLTCVSCDQEVTTVDGLHTGKAMKR